VPVSASTAVATRPGRNGGTLLTGGKHGNKGGLGQPTSALRQHMVGSLESRIHIAEDIADGRPVQKARFKPLDLIPYVVCANCGESQVKPKNLEDALFAEVEVEVSAAPKDRIAALDFLAKYGMGTIKEISVDNVRARLERTLDIIQQLVSPEQFLRIVKDVQPVWSK
jgi:hypothetical protein